jgi:hypothetical protein
MLSFDEFRQEHLKTFDPFKDKVDSYDVLLALYAKYIINNLEDGCYRVHCDSSENEDVSVDNLAIEVGAYGATYCCDLLDVDKIFVAEHEDIDYLLVGGDENKGGYNKLGTYIWCGFYGDETMVYGDILLIRKDMFVS